MIRRGMAICIALLLAAAGFAQENEVSLLDLIDTIEAIEPTILSAPEAVGSETLAELDRVAEEASVKGADDVAARARTLRFLAAGAASPVSPPADAAALPSASALVRGERTYSLLTAIGAGSGALSITGSALFYYAGERTYQRYLQAQSPADGVSLYRQWRIFDLLSLSFGAGAALAGITLPIIFAASVSPDATLAPLPAPADADPAQLSVELDALLERRAVLQARLGEVDELERRARRWKTAAVTTGALAAATSVVSYYLGDQYFDRYQQSLYSQDAAELASWVRFFDVVGVSGGVAAATAFGGALSISILSPDRGEIESRLRAVNARVIDLRLRINEATW